MTNRIAVADVLERAADLIEPEGAWTNQGYAVDRYGRATQDLHAVPDDATCFCAAGAIAKVGGIGRVWAVSEAVGRVVGFKYGTQITEWNDKCTQAEVVAKLREAAALAREQGL